jgi:hypothetical protein
MREWAMITGIGVNRFPWRATSISASWLETLSATRRSRREIGDDACDRIIQANVIVIGMNHEGRAQLDPDSRREGNGQEDDIASPHPHGFLWAS